MKLKAKILYEKLLSKNAVKQPDDFTLSIKDLDLIDLYNSNENLHIKIQVVSLDSKKIWCSAEHLAERHLMSGLKEVAGEIGLVRVSECGEVTIGENENIDIGHKKKNCEECEKRNGKKQ